MAKGIWVVLNVDNVDKSLEFYRMLGLKARTTEQDGLRWGEVEATRDAGLVLWNKNEVGPNQDQPDLKAWLSGELGKGVLLNVGVPNARRLWEKVQGKVTVDQPLADEPWGGSSFTVVDPDGYVVGLADRFPDGSTARRASKAAKRVATTARKAVKRATGKRGARRGR